MVHFRGAAEGHSRDAAEVNFRAVEVHFRAVEVAHFRGARVVRSHGAVVLAQPPVVADDSPSKGARWPGEMNLGHETPALADDRWSGSGSSRCAESPNAKKLVDGNRSAPCSRSDGSRSDDSHSDAPLKRCATTQDECCFHAEPCCSDGAE